MIEMQLDSSWRRFVSQSGVSEEQLLQFLDIQGQTKEDVTNGWKDSAEKTIRTELLMEKIKEKENFTVDEKELETEVEAQLQDITDENTRNYYKTLIEDDMKSRKLGEFLLANNTLKESETVSYEEFMAGHQH
jgi:trigger factor